MGTTPADGIDVGALPYSHYVKYTSRPRTGPPPPRGLESLTVTLEMGKPVTEAYAIELRALVNTFRWYGQLADKLTDESPHTAPDALALVTREPAGVVAAVVPWNFPLTLAVQDAFDLALARWTIESGLPLLAVCRGLQVVDVALSGTLEQDMGGPGREHRHVVHPVEIQRGTLLEQATGARTVGASCYHHQRVATVAPGLTVSARAADGTVEGLELPGAPGWFTAVQWHPEDTAHEDRAQQGLFDALVAAARDERRRPRLSSTLPARTRRPAG
ncbi:aldehyde dehydrogenase family protein [Streptomyces sp. NBC_00377]|uniref:gamma-glutamyl-gamma-aminobutyrate hydrolase family protein n=1 Tax=unclassified Streptomyces TaxID=2593676 RepID=UPI002E222896|nr:MULTISPECIES: aldehyde dehydrogenase family protein [unclassified Streptomyces]